MIIDEMAFYVAINTVILALGILIGLLVKQKDNSNITTKEDIESVYNYKPNRDAKKSYNNRDKIVNQIEIDTSTFVSELDTSGLSKKYENIGNKSETNEEIQSSIDKLKKLKKGY